MLKAVLFDLDNTLLPMNEEEFIKVYFSLVCKKLAPLGFEPKKLVKTIWGGTYQMISNDGKCSNSKVFWTYFENVYGINKEDYEPIFDDFYKNEFKKTRVTCRDNPYSRDIIKILKDKGLKIILISNPIYPKQAYVTRMAFAGFKEEDFDYIATYDNSSYSKPNPKFIEEVLVKNNLKKDEVIVIGNSFENDIEPAQKLGIKTYLVGEESKVTIEEMIQKLHVLH